MMMMMLYLNLSLVSIFKSMVVYHIFQIILSLKLRKDICSYFLQFFRPLDNIHIRFGRVKGMSTRQGNVVFLRDVLDEARSRVIKSMEKRSSKLKCMYCMSSPIIKIDFLFLYVEFKVILNYTENKSGYF